MASVEDLDARSAEFQAVIVVDYDNRLFPLTESVPTCLLPIANRKLLAYQLDMLVKSGIAETFIVTPPDYEHALKAFLQQYCGGVSVSMNIDIIVADDMSGSADGLRAVSDRIRGDFIYLGADFICQASLAHLVTLHRSTSSDFTILLSTVSKENPVDDLDVEYTAISDEGRLLLSIPALEIEDSIDIPKHLLHRVAKFNLRKDLQDIGVYMMSHWIMQLLKENHRITSLKSDLVPFLIKRQYQSKDYLYSSMPALQQRSRPLSMLGSWLTSPLQRQTDVAFQTILGTSDADSDDLLRCFAAVYAPPSSAPDGKAAQPVTPFLLTRINSIAAYLNANKEMPLISYNSRTPWARVANYQKKELSVLGDNVDMGVDKSVTFKQCFIGNNCKIGSKAKLNNCVIMDNAIIGDNCIIQNCVVGERVTIEANCNLNECNIGNGCKISAGSRVKGESFSSSGH